MRALLLLLLSLSACAGPVESPAPKATNLARFLPDRAYRLVVFVHDPAFASSAVEEWMHALENWISSRFSAGWVGTLDLSEAFATSVVDGASPAYGDPVRVDASIAALRQRLCASLAQVLSRDRRLNLFSAENVPGQTLVFFVASGRASVALLRSGLTSDLAALCRALYPSIDHRYAGKETSAFWGIPLRLRGAVFLAPYVLRQGKRIRGTGSGRGQYEALDPWLYVEGGVYNGSLFAAPRGSDFILWRDGELPVLLLPWSQALPWPRLPPESDRAALTRLRVEARKEYKGEALVQEIAPSDRLGASLQRFLETRGMIPVPDARSEEPRVYRKREEFIYGVSVAEFLRRYHSLDPPVSLRHLSGGSDALVAHIASKSTMFDPMFSERGRPTSLDLEALSARLCPECEGGAPLAILPLPFGLREYNLTPDPGETPESEEEVAEGPRVINRRAFFRRIDYECMRDFLSAALESTAACPGTMEAERFVLGLRPSTYRSRANEASNLLAGWLVRDLPPFADEGAYTELQRYARRSLRSAAVLRRSALLWQAFTYSILARFLLKEAQGGAALLADLREREALLRSTFAEARNIHAAATTALNPVYEALGSALELYFEGFPAQEALDDWLETPHSLRDEAGGRALRGYMKLHPDNFFPLLETLRVPFDYPLLQHCRAIRKKIDGSEADSDLRYE